MKNNCFSGQDLNRQRMLQKSDFCAAVTSQSQFRRNSLLDLEFRYVLLTFIFPVEINMLDMEDRCEVKRVCAAASCQSANGQPSPPGAVQLQGNSLPL